jgi:NifU-like protein involved in Fe-S cluster formation
MLGYSLLDQIPWTSIVLAAGVLFVVVAAWTWFQSKVEPDRGTIDSPDATAYLRGKCGDAMKISLKIAEDRVVEAKYWTDGCRMSSACGAAVAKLALHKTVEEIADIDHVAVAREAGGLPEEDLHCATLAAGTLQEALRIYFLDTGVTSAASNSDGQVSQNHKEFH